MAVLNVCVAGVTGWTGEAVARGVRDEPDLQLRCGVARSAAGREHLGVAVYATVAEALDAGGVDVLVDYTSHAAVGANVRQAVERGVSVVVGSSGLSGEDYEQIAELAVGHGVGVVASGNFSLTAAMAQAAAKLAARHLPHWEIIDYASAQKPDAPSGTARELAEQLAAIRRPEYAIPPEQTAGHPEARGAAIADVQVHSVRLPGYVIAVEAIFGLPDERLTIRHDAGSSATPYVAGTLLAIRAAAGRTGFVRGLDSLLLEAPD
ncbi:MAG TPA: 4-hydroxy-tetrahydrodipicolinate reductase [Jatrophihabitantaceae bacterium]|jgi:4-hydroxy-tetrahydrodipicolinate reductase